MPLPLFALGYFSDMVSLFSQAGLWPRASYLCLLCSWDYRCTQPLLI
jgi:hypothetical protein